MHNTRKNPEKSDAQRTEQLLKQILQQLTALNNFQRFQAMGPERIHQFLYADRIFSLYLPYADTDLIQKLILTTHQFFELAHLKTVQNYLSPGSVVIDAGANIGNHSLFFAGVLGAEKVYAFEPQREIFRILERNIHLNELNQISAINAALGAEPGHAELDSFRAANIGKTTFVKNDSGSYEMTTLDTLNLERVDFIKMDVEGAHLAALEGARQTLARCKPILWVELRRKFGEFEPASTWLTAQGYRLERALGPDDFLFMPTAS